MIDGTLRCAAVGTSLLIAVCSIDNVVDAPVVIPFPFDFGFEGFVVVAFISIWIEPPYVVFTSGLDKVIRIVNGSSCFLLNFLDGSLEVFH